MRITTQKERDEAMITIEQLVDAVERFDAERCVNPDFIPATPQFAPGVKTFIAGSLQPQHDECPGYKAAWAFIDGIQDGKIQWSGADKMYYEYPED